MQNHSEAQPVGADIANHLALTVHGLPTRESPSGDWLVDVGLGDALHEPIPLHEGSYAQGPFRYGLRRSEVEPGGWRWGARPARHDSPGWTSVRSARPRPTSGLATSSSPRRRSRASCAPAASSGATRGGVDALTGCVLTRIDGGGAAPITLATSDEWFDALRDVFDLPLDDVDAARASRALGRGFAPRTRRWLAAVSGPVS